MAGTIVTGLRSDDLIFMGYSCSERASPDR